MFTRADILKAKAEIDVHIIRGAAPTNIKWKDISAIYDEASQEDILHASFSSLIIHNTHNYTKEYDSLIKQIALVHGGQLIDTNSIIHFLNRNSDETEDKDAIAMREKFFSRTPHKIPNPPLTYEQFSPTIHVDRADGFFIQNEGSTLWTVYRDQGTKEYTLNPGDMMYIPKFTVHRVDSLNPRHSTSIVFKDPQHIVCKHCGFLNI